MNDQNEIRYCALPECGRIVTNWRMKCCCRSHQGKYSAKSRHGTLGLPNKKQPGRKGPKKVNLTLDQKKALWVAYVANRRRHRDKSMPIWADRNKITQFYLDARQLTTETGVKHEVDHIIPSNHPLVCGLHNEFNLQILTKTENCRKSNKFEVN